MLASNPRLEFAMQRVACVNSRNPTTTQAHLHQIPQLVASGTFAQFQPSTTGDTSTKWRPNIQSLTSCIIVRAHQALVFLYSLLFQRTSQRKGQHPNVNKKMPRAGSPQEVRGRRGRGTTILRSLNVHAKNKGNTAGRPDQHASDNHRPHRNTANVYATER